MEILRSLFVLGLGPLIRPLPWNLKPRIFALLQCIPSIPIFRIIWESKNPCYKTRSEYQPAHRGNGQVQMYHSDCHKRRYNNFSQVQGTNMPTLNVICDNTDNGYQMFLEDGKGKLTKENKIQETPKHPFKPTPELHSKRFLQTLEIFQTKDAMYKKGNTITGGNGRQLPAPVRLRAP